MSNKNTMKIYITKPDPMRFVHRGMGYFNVWFGAKPVFLERTTHDENGILLPRNAWDSGSWACSKGGAGSMLGNVFFEKFKNTALFEDVWSKIINTYNCKKSELHPEIMAKYESVKTSTPQNSFFEEHKSNEEKMALFLKRQSEDILREKAAELPGLGWREMVLEYDVDFTLTDVKENEKHSAWLCKAYNDVGFSVFLGKDKPCFRHATIIDGCFYMALKPKDIRPAGYFPSVRTDVLPITAISSMFEAARDIVEPTFIGGVSCAVKNYNILVSEFKGKYRLFADNVQTKEDYLCFVKHDELERYSAIDIESNDNMLSFDDVTPNELAVEMLDVMANAFARTHVDVENCKFEEWVKPVSIDLLWEDPEH